MINFKNIAYLKSGNTRQQNAYKTLLNLAVFKKLHSFTPILTGTIPIEIDIPQSDLDIICQCADHQKFSTLITASFKKEHNFSITTYMYNGVKTTLCKFRSNGFDIEIFGQNIPTVKQQAYRHMIVEYHILKEKGTMFKAAVINLKNSGLKTEAAFAKLLQLNGDPYIALLNLAP